MSSSLNAASAVTWEDILKYFDVFGKLKEEKKALVTKLLGRVVYYSQIMYYTTKLLSNNVYITIKQCNINIYNQL